jgi:hypothetical protein
MRLQNGVEIPDKLNNALALGELVVFVGAGASTIAHPGQPAGTYYPDFSGLVTQIFNKLNVSFNDAQKKDLEKGFYDRVLGSLADIQMVRSTAVDILTQNEASQRTILHEAIVNIFAEPDHARIVTTNFDNLLTIAVNASSDGRKWVITKAPALLPGRRFKGLCYLHGSVTDPENMVLTDADIGRAYMDEAWALAFARSMFSKFSVLFVGYSLEDPPLRYLSLALERNSNWAMVRDPGNEAAREEIKSQWNRRRVDPIFIPVELDDHRHFEKTFQQWREVTSRSYLQKREYLLQQASVDPAQLLPYQLDLVALYLQTEELRRDFFRNKVADIWLDKLLEWGHLRALFDPNATLNQADMAAMERVANWIVANPLNLMERLQESRNRPRLRSELIFCVCRTIADQTIQISVENLQRILVFFEPAMNSSNGDDFLLFGKSVVRKLLDAGRITEVCYFLEASFSVPGTEIKKDLYFQVLARSGEDTSSLEQLEFEAGLPRVKHHSDILEGIVAQDFEKLGVELVKVLVRILEKLRRLKVTTAGREYTSMRHPTIDRTLGIIDEEALLINWVIRSWRMLLALDRTKAECMLERIKEIDDIIFRRIAIFLYADLIEKSP